MFAAAFRDEPSGSDVSVRRHVVHVEQVGRFLQAQLVLVVLLRVGHAAQTAIDSSLVRAFAVS